MNVGAILASTPLHEGSMRNCWPGIPKANRRCARSDIDIKTGNYEAAEAGIKTLLAKYPNHDGLPQAFCWLGNDYLDARQDDKAARCYQYVIDNSPDSNAAMSSWAGIARVHIRRGDDQAVQPVIDKIIADFNDNPEVATAVFDVGDEYYSQGVEAEKAKNTATAAANFTKSIAVWKRITEGELPVRLPHTVHAWYFTGYAYERMRDYGKAIECCEKVISTWPNCEYAWRALLRISKMYKLLMKEDVVSDSEGWAAVKVVYEQIVQEYPECPAAGEVPRWLERYGKSYEGGQK
jgi:outer membrane protein assembly factor BamD (BamD/ComL family)